MNSVEGVEGRGGGGGGRQISRVLNSFLSLSLCPSREAKHPVRSIDKYQIKTMLTTVLFLLKVILFVQAIKGQEGFNTTPPSLKSSFSCKGRETGLYADIDANCRIYHTCDNHGNKFSNYCPQDTAFRQELLVCDHAHLVDCKSSEKLISKLSDDQVNFEDKSDNFGRPSELIRSFKIMPAAPSRLLEAPKENHKKPTTFFMSSTVFLRETPSIKSKENTMQFNRNEKIIIPIIQENTSFENNNFSKNPKNIISNKYRNSNYPYSETLKSIQNQVQNRTEKLVAFTTTERTTTAGTDFPIPAFTGALAALGNSEEDPYYPRGQSTTEFYYPQKKEKNNKRFFLSTRRPWMSHVDLKIPDILPDLNSVDDLVDRRKIFFIPRSYKI